MSVDTAYKTLWAIVLGTVLGLGQLTKMELTPEAKAGLALKGKNMMETQTRQYRRTYTRVIR